MRPQNLLPDEPPIPPDEPAIEPDDIDENVPWELDDEYWDALAPDDDYEPLPEPGDFWTDDP